jgi:hypothetical protein
VGSGSGVHDSIDNLVFFVVYELDANHGVQVITITIQVAYARAVKE